MKNFLITIVAVAAMFAAQAQGNHVFSGGEAVNFGALDLATPAIPLSTWSTVRAATPGYFGTAIGATYSSASDAFNVNGYVKKYGNEAFTFPVGSGTDLRTLSISAPGTVTDAYAVAWILGNPTTTPDVTNSDALHNTAAVAGSIKRVMPVGQWDWQAINGAGAGLTVTTSMPDLTTFAPKGHLRLVGWDNATGKWIDLSGVANATDAIENSTIAGNMVAGIDAISIGSIALGFPDLTPSSKMANASFTASAGTTRDLVVEVNEILGNITDATSKVIQIRVSKSSSFNYTYNPATTSVNVPLPTVVQNPLWDLVSNTSTAMTFQLKAGNEIAGLAKSSFSISLQVNTAAAPSALNINIGVISLSGAEVVDTNNQVVRVISIQ
ncbi:hypothetical protein [Ferruginibacter sp.]|nr:hypothetical protein [Ferruginibacter sp.]